MSQGEAFTLASISYLAILVKYILAKKKKNSHHCGAKIQNEFSLSVAKSFALFVPTLSSGAIVLPIEKMNQINTKKLLEIEKEKKNVREVALGG